MNDQQEAQCWLSSCLCLSLVLDGAAKTLCATKHLEGKKVNPICLFFFLLMNFFFLLNLLFTLSPPTPPTTTIQIRTNQKAEDISSQSHIFYLHTRPVFIVFAMLLKAR